MVKLKYGLNKILPILKEENKFKMEPAKRASL